MKMDDRWVFLVLQRRTRPVWARIKSLFLSYLDIDFNGTKAATRLYNSGNDVTDDDDSDSR